MDGLEAKFIKSHQIIGIETFLVLVRIKFKIKIT